MQEFIDMLIKNIHYVIGGLSAFFGALVPIIIYLIKWYLESITMRKKTRSYVNNYFYKTGLKVKKKSIDIISNKALKNDLIEHLDTLSDIAQEAFDAGISGKAKPLINE